MVTIEDRIDYVHTAQKCMIDQREIGCDALSYEASLTHAMRKNLDVILVGEMRSREAISAAIMLAEMRHLVRSTVHANDAVQTLHRILQAFSSASSGQVRMQLSLPRIGVLCQRLLLSKDGELKLAVELSINTPAIAGQIREDRLEQIYDSMEFDASSAMIKTNHSQQNLVDKSVVEPRMAERFMNAFQTRRR